jgi:AcrR family transcriptional regulator
VSDLNDRRARKKAQTRDQIRCVAHRLFAERGFDVVTIADIAREADVAVQTVFNHFATKEELYFDGRTPWVTGAADAVRDRDPSVPPLTALRSYLVPLVESLVSSLACSERRCYVTTLEASHSLRTHERELVFEAERRLAAALLEAWADADGAPADPHTAAALAAGLWMTTVRVLVVDHRPLVGAGADPEDMAATVAARGERVLLELETCLGQLPPPAACADTGWPEAAARQVG